MASTTDVREWARQEGIEVASKGPLKPDLVDRYERAHPDLVQSPSGLDRPHDDEDDYDGGTTEADLPAADPGQTGERKPRPPASSGPARNAGGRLASLIKGRAKPSKAARPGRRPPRVKLDAFAEGVWSDLAEVAPWPPLRTCLQFQGAYAAAVFDDVVAGTLIDRPMQSIAKTEAKLRALDGLFGPPIFTAAICVGHQVVTNPDGSPRYDEAGWPVFDQRTQLMFMGLKYSLRQMARIADVRIEDIEEKAAEIDARNAKVEALVAAMFASWRRPPEQAPGEQAQGPGPAQGEQANGHRAGPPMPGFIYPQPPGMDNTGADPGRTP